MGQFFYKMAPGIKPQWIRTYPELESPRTGDGLFADEVIEVTQVHEKKKIEQWLKLVYTLILFFVFYRTLYMK